MKPDFTYFELEDKNDLVEEHHGIDALAEPRNSEFKVDVASTPVRTENGLQDVDLLLPGLALRNFDGEVCSSNNLT